MPSSGVPATPLTASDEFPPAFVCQSLDTFVSSCQFPAFFLAFNRTQFPLLNRRNGLANLNEFKLGICF